MEKRRNAVYRFITVLFLSFTQLCVWAQDTTETKTTDKGTSAATWFTQPWVWIVGGILLLLILVAAFRGPGKNITIIKKDKD